MLKGLSCLIIIFVVGVQVAFAAWPEFYLYTRSNKVNYVNVTDANIKATAYSSTKRTYFIVHGFNSNGNTDWIIKIKDGLLTKEDANVIAVNWDEGAKLGLALDLDYSNAANNAKLNGERIGTFIIKVGMASSNVHCIGHSLGAHACGFAGKRIKIARITGMDPAGPKFRDQPAAQRLATTDATLVDCIHTDSIFGIQQAIGHKDFFPNGGAQQPGCILSGKREGEFIDIDIAKGNTLSCSHGRAPEYFAESVTSTCKFKSIRCNSYDEFKKNQCTCSTTYGCSTMGFSASDSKETGLFFLDTNSKVPYCL